MTVTLIDSPDMSLRDAIVQPLIAFNAQQTGIDDFRLLALTITDDAGAVVGGLWARTAMGWLFVELLFVPEALRGQGIGRELLRRAEAEAIARGCHHVWLDTFEFQARGFYERLGYRLFGELTDYPAGYSRYFMQKALGGDSPLM
jgi:GNAT superfamily N-acetyltransferase